MKRRGVPGEPDRAEDSVAGAAREDADSQDDTNAQLRAMRAVWLSMREEDPPDGGLVDLLAAARTKAATMRARPTWWQRVLAFARRPPALAFATVVVLVGGAMLFIGRRAGMRADLAAGSSGVVTRSEPPAKLERAAGEPVEAMGIGAKEAPRDSELEPPPRPVQRGAHATASATVTTTERREAAAPVPAAAPAVEVRVDVGKRAGDPALEKMYEQCESAARRGDCVTVRKIVGRIAKTDGGYRARLEKQAAVAKCLGRRARDVDDDFFPQ